MKKQLEKLLEIETAENKNSWKSKFAIEMDIWEEIAFSINSCEGKEQLFWEGVMDLYNKKYR